MNKLKYTEDELEKLQKQVVYLRDRDMQGCLFGYSTFTAECATTGEDFGDFSLLLFENGIVEYKEYLCFEIPQKVRKYTIGEKYVQQIRGIICKHSAETEQFEDTDNELVYDGSCEYIFVNGKWTGSFNIFAVRDHNDTDNKELQIEKMKLALFDEICAVFKKAGVGLTLNSVKIHLFLKIRSLFCI